MVDRVAAAHPAAQPAATSEAAVRDVLPVHTIDDVRAFKASLRASDVPHPILPWSAYEQAPQETRDAELAVPDARDAAPRSVRANM